MITADEVRRLIVAHDASRPRSRQTAIGPSDLSSPCDRRLGYQLLGVPRVVPSDVNLYAYVGTGIHFQMEKACVNDNAVHRLTLVTPGEKEEVIADLPADRWLTEIPVAVPVTDTVEIRGHCDAYDRHTYTCIDWKSHGTAKPSPATRAKHHTQLLPYGLGLILQGHRVDHTAVVYIPRNGLLADISVDVRPFDHDAAERLLRRYEALITAASIGEAVLPLLPTASDCRFCGWWNPNAWVDGLGCGGHETPGVVPVETQPNSTKETT